MCSLELLDIWKKIIYQALCLSKKEPILSNFYQNNILKHKNLSSSLSYILSNKLSTYSIPQKKLQEIFNEVYLNNSSLCQFLIKDIKTILKKDPVVKNYLTPLLYFKGFHALEAYRLSHYFWNIKKNEFSIYLQSRISSIFSVDIHPAAYIGSGVMFDHANGIVIGEGVIIKDNVSIFHSVTLGGTGKDKSKNRHPKIHQGVTIGAGAKILGNIEIGSGTKIGAGSIVLHTMPSDVTVAGVPGKIVKKLYHKNDLLSLDKHNRVYSEKFQYGDGI